MDIAVMSYLPTTEFSHPQRFVWSYANPDLPAAVMPDHFSSLDFGQQLITGCGKPSSNAGSRFACWRVVGVTAK